MHVRMTRAMAKGLWAARESTIACARSCWCSPFALAEVQFLLGHVAGPLRSPRYTQLAAVLSLRLCRCPNTAKAKGRKETKRGKPIATKCTQAETQTHTQAQTHKAKRKIGGRGEGGCYCFWQEKTSQGPTAAAAAVKQHRPHIGQGAHILSLLFGRQGFIPSFSHNGHVEALCSEIRACKLGC